MANHTTPYGRAQRSGRSHGCEPHGRGVGDGDAQLRERILAVRGTRPRGRRVHELRDGTLFEAVHELLAEAPRLDPVERAQVVGAARYFVSTADAVPDHTSCTGLDDVVAVFNHVARSIDRLDLCIED